MPSLSDGSVSPVVKGIKRFFRVKGHDFIILKQDTGNTRYVIKFNEPLKVTGAKYDKFYGFLMDSGFYLVYSDYGKLGGCPGYECFKWFELYENDDGSEVSVEYIEKEVKGKSEVYIERIDILTPTGH